MKKLLAASLLLSSMAFAAETQVVEVNANHLFIPAGFDNNDNVEIVVTGYFPNLCYSRNKVEVEHEGSKINVTVTALFRGEEGKSAELCPPVIVPFTEVVALGNLQGGDYDVVVNPKSESRMTKRLKIAEASSNAIDEYIYSYAEYVEKKEDGLYLHGSIVSSCLQLDRIEYLSNKEDTVSVLPIMKKVSNFCPMKMVPYVKKISPPLDEMKSSSVLMHVRTVDGRSVNTVVELQK